MDIVVRNEINAEEINLNSLCNVIRQRRVALKGFLRRGFHFRESIVRNNENKNENVEDNIKDIRSMKMKKKVISEKAEKMLENMR